MAVVSVTEDFKGRTSSSDERGKTAVRVFQVVCDAFTDGTEVAINANDGTLAVPAVGSEHPDDTRKRLRSKSCDPVQDEPCVFRVVCNYDTHTKFVGIGLTGGIDPAQYENPLLLPPLVEVGYDVDQIAFEKDFADPPVSILNSAGQAFDPPPTRSEYCVRLTVQRNRLTFDLDMAAEYGDSVNSTDWHLTGDYSILARRAKCIGISARQAYTNSTGYWVVTYEFSLRLRPWNPVEILDQGLAYRDDDGELIIAKDFNGDAVTFPVNLNGSGQRLVETVSWNDPVYLEFQGYRETDFNALNLLT